MQFLRRQTGKNVALRDVPNLVSKLKEARRGQTKTEDRLELVLRNFCRGKVTRRRYTLPRSADGGCYHNTKNARHKQFRFLDSRRHRPRKYLCCFVAGVWLYHWHGPLTNYVTICGCVPICDCFWIEGQCVQRSLMENESAECLNVQQHVGSRARHYLIIVDNDFGAISLLQEAFPGARVLLCVFHVVKYIRGEAARRDYGVIDLEKVEDAVYLMLNVQPEEEYDTGFKYLYYVVEGKQITKDEDIPEPVHPFLRYFHAN
ncbi:hypothetical protein GQ600_15610 [Phytophthora cactorum]|nr:hypothetical protein GQ600_15610 [Phytophthora cactorum]